ncbi:MAG TPA: class I SAM-dependent methyltransferase, partial [Alphaproteobacteria bacterium]|nr:class I SAM-dependent methyltransferase [Alphaproteobacteria bacterium]
MQAVTYAEKQPEYFALARREIGPLLPEKMDHVLEVGCGAGGTLSWLKASRSVSYAAGVELMPSAAERARAVCDEIVVGDVERVTLPFAPGSFDLILALDVLEHLVDPWSAVRRLHGLLRPGGYLIASVPNVAHYSVSLPLLRGRWNYVRSGILDGTHLRF